MGVQHFQCNWGIDFNQFLLIPVSTLEKANEKYTFQIILLNLISCTCTGKYWNFNEFSDSFLLAAKQFKAKRGERCGKYEIPFLSNKPTKYAQQRYYQ